MLADESLAQLSSQWLDSAADVNRHGDPQPNIRQSSGSLEEEYGIRLRELEESRTPQKIYRAN